MSRVVTCTWVDLAGNPRSGWVSFTPTQAAQSTTERLLPAAKTVQLDSDGAISVDLECTDDAAWSSFLITVDESRISGGGGQVYTVELPTGDGSAISLTALATVGDPDDASLYMTRAAVEQLFDERIAALRTTWDGTLVEDS